LLKMGFVDRILPAANALVSVRRKVTERSAKLTAKTQGGNTDAKTAVAC
jgi:hypothetical protein